MFEEEPPKAAPVRLDLMSEEELERRIEALGAEIAACRTELDKKRAHRNAADALFKTD